MPICNCCKPIFTALGGDEASFACENSTPTEQGKRFSIESSSLRFCRIQVDVYIPESETKCDYVFAQCPEGINQETVAIDYQKWLFVELAGDRKSMVKCIDQLKASITHIRQKANLPKKVDLTGYIIGGEAPRRTSDKSNAMRDFKDKFVKEGFGKLIRQRDGKIKIP